MKHILNALKDKPYSKKELIRILKKKFPQSSEEASRKKCERYLRKLQGLGLVEKRGDKYCWYTYENLFKDREDYSAKLLHSRQLILALREITGIRLPRYSVSGQEEYVSPEDMTLFVKCAEDHLRAYPEVWRFLEDSKRIREKVERERGMFCANLMEKLRKEFEKEPIVEPNKASRCQSFVKSNLPLLIYTHIVYGSPTALRLEREKIWFGGSLVAKGSHLSNSIREFVKRETEDESNIEAARRIGKIEGKAVEPQRRLQQEIRKLILRIESGEPLLGGCEICPRIYFSNTHHISERDEG